jgi:hypothetical protein
VRVARVFAGTVQGQAGTTVVELRREAVSAVARQQKLREALDLVRARAAFIETRAKRALGRGEEIRARRIIAQGVCTLKERDALEEKVEEARRRVSLTLVALVQAENEVFGLSPVR